MNIYIYNKHAGDGAFAIQQGESPRDFPTNSGMKRVVLQPPGFQQGGSRSAEQRHGGRKRQLVGTGRKYGRIIEAQWINLINLFCLVIFQTILTLIHVSLPCLETRAARFALQAMLGRYRSPKSKITVASESSHPWPYPGTPLCSFIWSLFVQLLNAVCWRRWPQSLPWSALCRSLNHMKSKMMQLVLYDSMTIALVSFGVA